MNMRSVLVKCVFWGAFLALAAFQAKAQNIGEFGIYYDQRELLFESLPTSESDIIFLGNSITDGGEWAEVFQNPHCKNRGISADVIPGVLNRLTTVTKGKPAMVFLMIGTNDMSYGSSNDSIAQGVRAIVRRIKEESPKTRIIVESILPTNDCYGMYKGHTQRWENVAVVNGLLKTVSEEEGVDYLDLYRHFATEEGKLNPELSNDGLHLNGQGYQLWKAIVEEEIGRFPKPVYRSKVPVWLNLGLGQGIPRCFDQGASPLRYAGIAADLNMGVTVEWSRYHVQADTRGSMGFLLNTAGAVTYDFGIDLRAEFLYRCYENHNNHLYLWAGAAAQDFIDIRYYPQLMNASIGASVFGSLQGVGMVQYDFAPLHDGEHNLFTCYAKLSLPLLTRVSRPGYAYMDNYTSDLETSATILSDYEKFYMFVPGVTTDVGLYFNMFNNNKIGISYRWDYLTTRNQGTYRYDRAAHTLFTTFMFNLN